MVFAPMVVLHDLTGKPYFIQIVHIAGRRAVPPFGHTLVSFDNCEPLEVRETLAEIAQLIKDA
jgi:hypothetical protein